MFDRTFNKTNYSLPKESAPKEDIQIWLMNSPQKLKRSQRKSFLKKTETNQSIKTSREKEVIINNKHNQKNKPGKKSIEEIFEE